MLFLITCLTILIFVIGRLIVSLPRFKRTVLRGLRSVRGTPSARSTVKLVVSWRLSIKILALSRSWGPEQSRLNYGETLLNIVVIVSLGFSG